MKLNTPRFRVVYQLTPEAEPVEVEVQSVQADTIRYDLLRMRHGWPGIQEAPILWATVVAWATCRRTGIDLSPDFTTAMSQILDVESLQRNGQPVDGDTTEDDMPAAVPTLGTA